MSGSTIKVKQQNRHIVGGKNVATAPLSTQLNGQLRDGLIKISCDSLKWNKKCYGFCEHFSQEMLIIWKLNKIMLYWRQRLSICAVMNWRSTNLCVWVSQWDRAILSSVKETTLERAPYFGLQTSTQQESMIPSREGPVGGQSIRAMHGNSVRGPGTGKPVSYTTVWMIGYAFLWCQ